MLCCYTASCSHLKSGFADVRDNFVVFSIWNKSPLPIHNIAIVPEDKAEDKALYQDILVSNKGEDVFELRKLDRHVALSPLDDEALPSISQKYFWV